MYFQDWLSQHKWFGIDRRKTADYILIATELRLLGEMSIGEAFLDKVEFLYKEKHYA